jgi:RNA polymerase sigma-70 factor (ECF subfamily)
MNPFVQSTSLAPGRSSANADNDNRDSFEDHSDAHLLERAGRGEAAAFAEIVHRHTAALYRVSYRMLGRRTEAEDVVQECFAKLWIKAPGWQEQGAGAVAWLHRVAINLCYDRLRQPSSRTAEAFPDLVDTSPWPDEVLAEEQASRLIETALKSLPERYRVALVLSYYEGFPNAVVAEIMQLNIKGFESLLLRARRHLRKMLERQGLSRADFQVRV